MTKKKKKKTGYKKKLSKKYAAYWEISNSSRLWFIDSFPVFNVNNILINYSKTICPQTQTDNTP